MGSHDEGKLLALRLQKEEAQAKVRQAIKLLFAVAGLNLFLGVFLWYKVDSDFILWGTVLASAALGGLGFWARHKPTAPLVISLVLLIGLYGLQMVASPSFSLIGIALRLAILMFLFIGLINVFKSRKVIREYEKLKSSSRITTD